MDFKKTMDKAIKATDAQSAVTYNDIKEVFDILSQVLQASADEKKWMPLVGKAQSKLMTLAAKTKGY